MVFIKKCFKTQSVIIDENFEIISFIFSPNSKIDVSLIACYRSPKAENEDAFLSVLEKKVNDSASKSTETVILGDLNFNQFDRLDKGRKLNEFNNTHGFFSTNTKVGTCYNHKTQEWSLLDVILCYFLNFLVAT